jgi:hypothetical protein
LKRLALISVSTCLLLSSCYLEDTDIPFIGYEYFETDLGRYIEYKVDSVWQDDPVGSLGFAEAHYFLRDVNESNFIDEEGRNAVRVERYWKQSAPAEWDIKDVWHRVKTEKVAEQNEENIVFIKHNFPVREGKTWDGNKKNTLLSLQEAYHQVAVPEVWDYSYINVHQPYTINGFTFDSTVTVLQMDRPAIFGLNVFAQEVYAKDIGLVHKQLSVFDIQQNPSNPNGRDTVGFVFEMVVTDYGQ